MPQLSQDMGEMIRVFIPITKVDVAKRIVYGTLAAEIPDKSGEIMDYDTAKVAIQEWSDDQSEASEGKSLGNVREMHGNVAAGKLVDLIFLDDEKKVEGAAHIIDDSTWNKVEAGVLTSFSIGGGYKKRWIDPTNPQLKRYTPKVNEFSLVDNPCQPGTTFEVVKADGTTELRKFLQPTDSAQEAQSKMTNTATAQAAAQNKTASKSMEVPAPEKLWKASDGTTHKSKRAALEKNAALLVDEVTGGTAAALKKLDGEVAAKEGTAPAADAPAAAGENSGTADKSDTDAAAAGTAEAPAAGADSATHTSLTEGGNEAAAGAEGAPAAAESAAEGGAAEKAAPAGELKKGLYEVSRMADLIQSLAWFQSSVDCEATMEKDGSMLPDALKAAIKTLGDWLKAYVVEEVDELFPTAEGDVVTAIAKGAPTGALAKFIRDDTDGLAKAAAAIEFADRLEKVNKTAGAHLAAMFDHHGTMQKCMDGMSKCMKALGMGDDDSAADDDDVKKMAKGAGMTDEQLTKLAAFDGLQKKFDELAPQLATITERLAKVEATPAETKGVVNTALVVKKGGSGENPSGGNPAEVELNKMIQGGASPEQTAQALMKLALRNGAKVA